MIENLCRELASVGPDGWERIELRSSVSPAHSVASVRSGGRSRGDRRFDQLVPELLKITDRARVDLTLDADGRYELLVAHGVAETKMFERNLHHVVLDPHHRPVPPREPDPDLVIPDEVLRLDASLDLGDDIDEVEVVPPDLIVSYLATEAQSEAERAANPAEWGAPCFYQGPPDVVRRMWWNPRWIPIGDFEDGRQLAIDLDPGPAGVVGQVLELDYRIARYVGPSLQDYLERRDLPVPETLDHMGHLRRRDLAESVASFPDRDWLQQLQLNDVADADLSPLASVPLLRELKIDRGGALRIGDLARCPLERLELNVTEVDLGALEGHPTLTSLTVTGGAEVRLPHLPALKVLDVGDAVLDVAELPPLSFLTLNPAQWASTTAKPAVAGVRGELSVPELARWAARRTGGPVRLNRVESRLSW